MNRITKFLDGLSAKWHRRPIAGIPLSAPVHKLMQPVALLAGARSRRADLHQAWRKDPVGLVFNPGIAHLNRLSFRWKFGLIGILALLTIGLYVGSLNVSMRGAISAARNERAALALYGPVSQALQSSRRYMLYGFGTTSNTELKPLWQRQGVTLENAIAGVTRSLSGADDFGLNDKWTVVEGDWKKLHAAEATLSADRIRTETAKFNRELLDFMGDLGEASGLVSDKVQASNYLADLLIRKLPQAADRLATMNANAMFILGTRDMGAEWGHMSMMAANAARGRDDLHEAMAHAGTANPALKEQLQKVDADLARRYADQFEAVDREILRGGFAMAGADFASAAGTVDEALRAQEPVLMNSLARLLDVRVVELENRFWRSSGTATILLLILAYFAAALFVTIMDAIAELRVGAQRIGEGDLGFRIAYSARDEMRVVAEQFNRMAETFANVIRQVQATVGELVASSQALSEAAGRISQGSGEQSEAAAAMAAAVEQMTVGITEISNSASLADGASQESAQFAEEGGEVVQQTMDEMERIAGAVNESASVIEELGANSRKIQSAIVTIKEIADQTNLLALNASIEAARAGEDGRGFSVVADEVRKLADRTAKATAEIGSMVAAIQAGTGRAVATMHDSVLRVEGGVALTKRSGEAIQRIRDESARVLAAVAEISTALHEQATASTEIAHSVENVARMAESNNAAVTHTGATANHLAGLAEQLGRDIGRFRL